MDLVQVSNALSEARCYAKILQSYVFMFDRSTYQMPTILQFIFRKETFQVSYLPYLPSLMFRSARLALFTITITV